MGGASLLLRYVLDKYLHVLAFERALRAPLAALRNAPSVYLQQAPSLLRLLRFRSSPASWARAVVVSFADGRLRLRSLGATDAACCGVAFRARTADEAQGRSLDQ